MQALRKIFNILSGIVYIGIIAYLLIAAPLVAGYHPVVVLSGSMEPTYHVASVIYYKEAAFDQIQTGDAITFHAGDNAMVTHRVIEKDEAAQAFMTKGDANETQDTNPVSYKEVAGKTAKISIPYAGYLVSYGKQAPVIIGMAAIIVISLILDNLFPKKKKSEERIETDEEKQE